MASLSQRHRLQASARAGSFAAAAKELNVPRPRQRMVRLLEQRLRVSLFVRAPIASR
jgi:DNA-binding transcriptional LysR family regulator